MPRRRGLNEGKSSKETGDSKKKSQMEHGKSVYDATKVSFKENEAKQSRDKAQQSDVGSSTHPSKNIEIPENFKHISGNTEFANANVILLGEAHISQHNRDIVDFINTYAKKGDIVLVEGTQSGQEQDKLYEELGKAVDLGHLTTHEARPILNKGNTKTYSKLVEKGIITPFRKDIKMYGWDDMKAYDTERKAILNRGKIPSNPEDSILSELREKFDKMVTKLSNERDQKMLETIHNMRSKFPNKTLFIVAGKNHTESSMVQENLEKYPHIILEPNYQTTESDRENCHRIFLELSQERGRTKQ